MHNNRYAIALGMFDGMHIGHRALVERTVAFAREHGCKSMVYTFKNHPLAVLGRDPGTLMTEEERTSVMKHLGIDEVIMLPFSREFAAIQPEDFLQQLVDRYHMCAAFAGFNYTFGDKGRGDEPLLRRYGKEHHFDVYVLPPVLYRDEPVSSTRIRKALLCGNLKEAAAMLGEPYQVSGTLAANVNENYVFHLSGKKVLPGNGNYLSQARSDDEIVPAEATIRDNDILVRFCALSDRELSGRNVQLHFLEKLENDR